MIPLPKTFKKNTFFYEQVLRRGDIAIYQQRLREGAGCLAFEVFKIKKCPDWNSPGGFVPAHEAGPSNEEFGKSAWSYPTLEMAKKKMRELEEKASSKK